MALNIINSFLPWCESDINNNNKNNNNNTENKQANKSNVDTQYSFIIDETLKPIDKANSGYYYGAHPLAKSPRSHQRVNVSKNESNLEAATLEDKFELHGFVHTVHEA